MTERNKLSINKDNLSDDTVKQLSDAEQQQREAQKAENLQKEQEIIAIKRQKTKDALQFLQQRFSKILNYKSPLPLKLKIIDDIFNDSSVAEKITLGDFSKTNVHDALKMHTYSKHYHHAIVNGTHRYDFAGKAVSEIEPKHKEFSKKMLLQKQAKKNNKK